MKHRFTKGAIAIALIGALTGCADFMRQRIFKPEPVAAAPHWAAEPPTQVTTTTADGLTLKAYWFAQREGGDVLVYFHGNAGNALAASAAGAVLVQDGAGVLVASYRSYGDNPGKPSEAGLFADASAWMAFAQAHKGKGKLYIFGHSLGGAVAMEMAGRYPNDGLVTLGTFTSIAEMAPIFAKPLMPDRFDNLSAIRRVQSPITLFHGTEDQTIPFRMGEKLRDASGGRARFVPLTGGGHNVRMEFFAPLVWRALRDQPLTGDAKP